MYLKVLCDNNSLIDRYYLAEPALSFYIEDGESRILFDTGYSDVFIKNASKMNIDLNKIDTIVLSHGHNDHTGGLRYLRDLKQDVKLICHPNTDERKFYQGLDISSPVRLDELASNFNVIRSKETFKVSEHITFLGEIKRNVQKVSPLENDELWDDSALVYEDDRGIFIITGCSHSGICNIIEQAKRITSKAHILGIIGGFHMLNNEKLNRDVSEYFSKLDIEVCYPCHCTDLLAKIALSKVVSVKEVGVDFDLEL